jgi:transcriptional regulator GlxA family with amidase domain
MRNYRSHHVRPGASRASRRVVVFAAPPVEELDIVGPWEVFASANNVVQGKARAYDIELVTTARRLTVTGDSGLTLLANRRYNQLKGDIDTLIVAGGVGAQTIHDSAVMKWLRDMANKVRRLASICTGAFLLAEAGILNGRCATTHWMFARDFARRYPRVTVESDRIYVQDRHIYTSAGVTAGMDLALALVEEDLGSTVALQVARALVLFLRRPGGQSQFSALLSSQASGHRPIRKLQVWITENVQQDLSVEKLASRVAMSPRNFARVFTREIGTTPAHFVEEVRIEFARRELETTEKSLEQIAAVSGFNTAEVMRRAFVRCVGTTPSAYRDHFYHRRSR